MNYPPRPAAILGQLPDLPLAACMFTKNPDLFFPTASIVPNRTLRQIADLCSGCEENVRCLEYALEHNIKEGFWGGISPQDRAEMKPRSNRRQRGDSVKAVDRLLALGMTLERACEEQGILVDSYKTNKYRTTNKPKGQDNE